MSKAAKAPKTKAPVKKTTKKTAPKNNVINHKGPKAKKPDQKNSPKLPTPPKPCSFTEPILRVCKPKAKRQANCDTTKQAPINSDQNGPQNPQIKVFYKQKVKGAHTDVIGPEKMHEWKKSAAGRHKTWKACRRLKLSGVYLEQLVNLHGERVAFGWQFSTMSMPSAFLRGLGKHVNAEPPHSRASKRSAASMNMKFMEDLSELYDRRWPLPIGRPSRPLDRLEKAPRANNYHVSRYRRPAEFSRLIFSSQGFVLKQEESLAGTEFVARLTLPKGNDSHGDKDGVSGNDLLLNFVLHHLVRNDDYADVYTAGQDLAEPSRAYHAHVFLSERWSEKDLRRKREKIKRLRASRDFHAESTPTKLTANSLDGSEVHLEIVLTRINDNVGEHSNVFRLHNTEKNFPVLPKTTGKAGKQPKYQRSYATVLRSQWRPPPKEKLNPKPVPESNHLAYRAWQGRHGTEKPNSVVIPQCWKGPEIRVSNCFAALSVEEQGNKAGRRRSRLRNRKKTKSNTPVMAPENPLGQNLPSKPPTMIPARLATETRPKSRKK